MDLPLGLVSALETGECVLFLGSGVGHNTTTPDGSKAPDGAALAKALADRFGIDAGDHPDLAQVAQVVEIRETRTKLITFLERALADLEPDDDLKWLASLTWKAIFTTNYDRVIERAYEQTADPTQQPVTINANSEFKTFDPKFQVPIYHLHGSLFSADAKANILITEQDYATFRDRRQMLFDQLRTSYATIPILYIGYSHRDANWKMITSELRAEFQPNMPPPSYRVAPSTPPIEVEILNAQGLTTIDGNLAELRFAVQARLGNIRVDPRNLDALAARIPTDLRDLFEESPAAVTRLLNSWDYVNQADFSGEPNTVAFHKGDRANWALIGRGTNFQRDIEQPLVDELLEFATDPKPRVTSQIVLGSGGYGISTLLMAVAAWWAQNKIGTTLFLRPGMTPIAADVEYAARNFPSPIIFCIDNAADYERDLAEVVGALRQYKIPAFVLLGERLNEWRQCRPTIGGVREHLLEALTDDEIHRLIDSLERTQALGKLADLDADLRFAAIKVRHQQQLLVTMREATEGKAFDAIIEDEYRNIADDRARDLYALVCAFSRVRALARDTMCADTFDVGVTELYRLLASGLEGILVWETVDEARGIEALRARHQIIADIVWNRCLDRVQHERILLGALNSLNLTFGVDVKAFEAFTRDEEAVDSLQTLEAKARFFELACRKDPLNGYVRQHFGRMLRRERAFELALSQVEKALELSPKSRAIHHTRGVILRDMALEAKSPELARRRLAQSEAAFESALRVNPRDEYSYQSLAELYLDWSSRAEGEDETVDYLNRAQEVIFRGLQLVPQRNGLYLVSSKIQEAMGNAPGRLSALKQAVAAAPTSAVAKFMLGSLLRRTGDLDGSIQVLLDGLKMYPDDPHLSRALALAYHDADRDLKESIAVLHLARMRGGRDPRFVATYAGMLVMDAQLDEAADVWKRAIDQNFSFADANRIGFQPRRRGETVRLPGRMVSVKAGYAFVASPGMPASFCPGARLSNLRLVENDVVEFEPAFSARGPVVAAIDPVLTTPIQSI